MAKTAPDHSIQKIGALNIFLQCPPCFSFEWCALAPPRGPNRRERVRAVLVSLTSSTRAEAPRLAENVASDIWTACKTCTRSKIRDHSWKPGHKLEWGRKK